MFTLAYTSIATAKQKSNRKNPCQSWKSKLELVAPKSDVLPLYHPTTEL